MLILIVMIKMVLISTLNTDETNWNGFRYCSWEHKWWIFNAIISFKYGDHKSSITDLLLFYYSSITDLLQSYYMRIGNWKIFVLRNFFVILINLAVYSAINKSLLTYFSFLLILHGFLVKSSGYTFRTVSFTNRWK